VTAGDAGRGVSAGTAAVVDGGWVRRIALPDCLSRNIPNSVRVIGPSG